MALTAPISLGLSRLCPRKRFGGAMTGHLRTHHTVNIHPPHSRFQVSTRPPLPDTLGSTWAPAPWAPPSAGHWPTSQRSRSRHPPHRARCRRWVGSWRRGPIWWVRNAKKIWEIWGFFAQMLMFQKKIAQDVHASIHSFCINLWLRMVLKYQLMGKIGGDWTAHDLGTSHSNQVRSLQKKTKTVQVTWPFSIKTLLEVEKNLLPKLGIWVFFLRFQGLKDSSQIVASNVGHLGQPWLTMEYWWLVASLVVSNLFKNSSET